MSNMKKEIEEQLNTLSSEMIAFEETYEGDKAIGRPQKIMNLVREMLHEAEQRGYERGVEQGRIIEAANCKDSVIDCHGEYASKAKAYCDQARTSNTTE